MARKKITDLIEELRSWLPNYDHGPDSFPHTLFRILASLPGGDELEDMGYEPMPGIGWKEADLLGQVLEAIQDKSDVEDLVAGLIREEEEEGVEERSTMRSSQLDRDKIQRALRLLHKLERSTLNPSGLSRSAAASEAIRQEGLNQAEADILLNSVHVKRSEVRERPMRPIPTRPTVRASRPLPRRR